MKFIVWHSEDNDAHIRKCAHFVTFGLSHGTLEVDPSSTVLSLDLSGNQPPPPHLCERFTGLDDEIADDFFSVPENEEAFKTALETLDRRMKRGPRGDCVTILIYCTAGRHRSVAMAERLAKKVGRWDGFKAECLHLDLGKGKKMQAQNASRMGATEMSEELSARGRTRSRHKARATSEVRAREERPREAAATADALLPPTEAPLREKIVSWGTTDSVRYRQQREIASRSAGPWGKDKAEARDFLHKQV